MMHLTLPLKRLICLLLFSLPMAATAEGTTTYVMPTTEPNVMLSRIVNHASLESGGNIIVSAAVVHLGGSTDVSIPYKLMLTFFAPGESMDKDSVYEIGTVSDVDGQWTVFGNHRYGLNVRAWGSKGPMTRYELLIDASEAYAQIEAYGCLTAPQCPDDVTVYAPITVTMQEKR